MISPFFVEDNSIRHNTYAPSNNRISSLIIGTQFQRTHRLESPVRYATP